MSGSHPVASGSIPGIGCAKSFCVLLAQLAEHPLNIRYARGRGIDTPNLHFFGGLAQMVERSLSSWDALSCLRVKGVRFSHGADCAPH
jgi:hypothetical protein